MVSPTRSCNLSRQQSSPFSWDKFKTLPKGGEPDYLIDTARLNRKLARRANNPYREHTCAFPVPKTMDRWAFERRAKQALGTFLETMEKEGWVLVSKLRFERRDGFHDLEQGAMPDCWEYRVTGLFKTTPKPLRIEVPPGLVKQDPEHRITLKEALRAE